MKLEVKDLKKTFGENEVLHGISFSVESGCVLGLLGRSGAGKTTIIRIIMNVFPANHGMIWMDGKTFEMKDYQMGYLPEECGLYPQKTVAEQLIYFAMLRGMSAKEAKVQMKKWLTRLGVSNYENCKLETLSKGNQQKVQLAQTLLTSPDMLILDEPFSGLDSVDVQLLKDVIKEQVQEGKLVLFSSQQTSCIEEFCDNIVILKHGNVVLSGALQEIKREFGRDRLVLSSFGQTSEELAEQLRELSGDILLVERIHKDCVIVKKKIDATKDNVLKHLLEIGVDLKYFGLYEPALYDIFVETVGNDE